MVAHDINPDLERHRQLILCGEFKTRQGNIVRFCFDTYIYTYIQENKIAS